MSFWFIASQFGSFCGCLGCNLIPFFGAVGNVVISNRWAHNLRMFWWVTHSKQTITHRSRLFITVLYPFVPTANRQLAVGDTTGSGVEVYCRGFFDGVAQEWDNSADPWAIINDRWPPYYLYELTTSLQWSAINKSWKTWLKGDLKLRNFETRKHSWEQWVDFFPDDCLIFFPTKFILRKLPKQELPKIFSNFFQAQKFLTICHILKNYYTSIPFKPYIFLPLNSKILLENKFSYPNFVRRL